ncbi:hypothetical protein BsWGS_03086 [Bradybaena similaris]
MHAVSDFELILATACDMHGVARGRFVFREGLEGAFNNGLGIAQAALFCGMLCDIPMGLTDYSEGGWPNGSIVPALATLRPMSWLSYGDQKVGHVLCDLLDQSREPEESSSREITIRQLKVLDGLGYQIWTSLDLSFTIFPKGSLEPVALHEDTSKLVHALTQAFSDSSLPLVSIGRGLEPGQLLISLGEMQGVEAADCLHWLHCALKLLCVKEGYDVTRMTRPLSGISGNVSSYTVRLTTENHRNAFGDSSSSNDLSAVARHWIAGLVQHGPAVTALARPTLNCYTGPENSNDLLNSWTTDARDRNHRLQVQTSSSGVSVSDRLPSAASNPYIAFGAIVAAGVDGIVKNLELDAKTSSVLDSQLKIPRTFSEAVVSLEQDKVFQNLIGPKFVQRFFILKKDYEVARLEKLLAENDGKDIMELERSIYLTSL